MRLEPANIPEKTLDAVSRSLVGRVGPAPTHDFLLGMDMREHDVWARDRGLRGSDELPGDFRAAEETWLALPHYVYSLGANTAGGLDPLGTAEPTMVRFLVHDQRGFSASAEIPVELVDEDEQVPDVSVGKSAQQMADLVDEVERSDLPGDHFEVRLLRAPALQLSALWLHEENLDDHDRFWVLEQDMDPGQDAMRGIDRQAMIELLHRLAREWAEAYSAAEDDPSVGG